MSSLYLLKRYNSTQMSLTLIFLQFKTIIDLKPISKLVNLFLDNYVM